MKKRFFLLSLLCYSFVFLKAQVRIVDHYGQLSVKGKHVVNQHGEPVQLRGMSLFWSQWMGQYYNEEVVKWLRDDWKSTVIRAAMGVEMGGYLTQPAVEKQKVMKVVQAAIDLGIYVIIDYHSHEAHNHLDNAKEFFSEMALKYGKYPNVLYELYNEPLKDVSWEKDIKPYSEEVIKAIRKHDPDNIIICGTRQWSQLVDEAAASPIKDPNVVYTLHYYAGTHKEWLRKEAESAMSKGIALFVSEFGTCDASGNGGYDPKESKVWWDFLDTHKISWCNWSVADKEETASVLIPQANPEGGWTNGQLTTSGKLVRSEMAGKNEKLFQSLKK